MLTFAKAHVELAGLLTLGRGDPDPFASSGASLPGSMSTRALNIAWTTSGRIPDSSPGGPALCSGMGEGYGAQI